MNFILYSLFALLMQGLLYNCNMVAGRTFHIILSRDSPCPGEFSGVPCYTLEQYAASPSTTGNITLLFEMGNHTLGSAFTASLVTKYSLIGDRVHIECTSSSAQINFRSLQEVNIQGINIWRCHGAVKFNDIMRLNIRNSSFRHSYRNQDNSAAVTILNVTLCYIQDSVLAHNENLFYGAALWLKNTTIGIFNSMFMNNTVKYSGGGGSCIHYQSFNGYEFLNITIVNSTFVNNTGLSNFGGVIHIHNSRYSNNDIHLNIIGCSFRNSLASYTGGVIYYVNKNTLTISSSEFINNSVTYTHDLQGGAIYSTALVSVTGSYFFNNTAGRQGGAIYSTSGIQCVHCRFENNSALYGGAVFVNNVSSFRSCDFVNNYARNYGGGIYIAGTNSSISIFLGSFSGNTAATLGGGAIYSNSRYSNVTVSESTFNYNSASYCSVLHVEEFFHFSISITESVFVDNVATGELLGEGGVACLKNASINIVRSIFEHNRAALHGGVLQIEGSSMLVEDSVFFNNSAHGDGGVFWTTIQPSQYDIRRSNFSHNFARDDGGVMLIGQTGSRVIISSCIFSFNEALDRGGVAVLVGSFLSIEHSDVLNNTAEFGGIAIACTNSNVTIMDDLVIAQDPIFPACTLYNGHINQYNTSIYTDPPLSAFLRQDLLYNYHMVGRTFHIILSRDSPCPGEFSGVPCLHLEQYAASPSTTGNITLLFEMGNHTLGSAFTASLVTKYSLIGDRVHIECTSSSAQINFRSLQEVNIQGINIWRCHGAVKFNDIMRLNIRNSSFRHSYRNQDNSAAVTILNVTLCYIQDSVLAHNENLFYGAALWLKNTTIGIFNSMFMNNTVKYSGGGGSCIHYQSFNGYEFLNITIVNSTFVNNTGLSNFGGVIHIHNSRYSNNDIHLNIIGCSFRNSLASYTGGVIYYVNKNTLTISSSEFINNSVTYTHDLQGGAIYSTALVSVTRSYFFNNTAGRQGGAIYSTSGVQCVHCRFENNSALYGGAVFVNNVSSFRSCDFVNNYARNYGGGIYIAGTNSSISIFLGSFSGNTAATLGGGAIYSNSRYSNVTVSESTFNYNSASYCSVLHVEEFFHFSISITESVFVDNVATGELLGEGGVACLKNASINIVRSIFEHNRAALHGGVLQIEGSSMLVEDSVFFNNSAHGDGGVFWTTIQPSQYNIRRSNFSHNFARDDGGVMLIGQTGSRVIISSCIFSFNEALDRGGVAVLVGSFLSIEHSDVFKQYCRIWRHCFCLH